MAGVSTKEIKNRIRSMESTRQITKAMEMVAASKLRRAQAQIANSRPYFGILYDTIQDIMRSNREFQSPYLRHRGGDKAMYVAVKGMVPANTIGTKAMTRLHCYKGAEHKNAAQKPETVEF